jgi:signal transduction histidine kinase
LEQSEVEQASVLVVDDNPLIVNVLRGLLDSADFQVYCCTNGQEALDMLDKKWVDVIICDVMMPRMDGYELHDLVRAKSELSHIPFIFLTALGGEEAVKAKEAGADDYVVKPFDPRELLAVVKGKVKRSKMLKNLSEEQYDAFRRRIIHTLSHEFRTPLVAINTGTELLLEQEKQIDNDKAQNLLEAIQRGGQRLERLVSDFMLMQQIEAGIADRLFESRAREASLSELVESYVQARRESLESSGFTITFKNLRDDLKVHVFEAQVQDILDRFIANSVKFSPEQKEIEVVVHQQLEEAIVEVRDRGIGIDEERIREATDLFGQIDRDHLEQQGGGFGLAIATRYASINGGRLEFSNRSGGGAAAMLYLPTVSE